MHPHQPVPRIAASARPEPPTITFPPWTEDALCRETGGELFFDRHTYHLAQQICARCPVTEPCREYGAEEEFGVWGGTTANQRDLSRARATCLRGHRKPDGDPTCWVCVDNDDPAESQEVA